MHKCKQAAEDELSSLSNDFLKCDGCGDFEEAIEPVLVCGKGQLHFFNYCPHCIEGDKKLGFTVLTVPAILQEFAKLKHPHNECTTACNCDPTPKTDPD